MYQVNDHVVYGNYGICVVKAIGKLEMDSAVLYTGTVVFGEKYNLYPGG